MIKLVIYFLIIPQIVYGNTVVDNCRKSGGQYKSSGCYCALEDRYINPQIDQCISKVLESEFNVSSIKYKRCEEPAHGILNILSGYSPFMVEEEKICSNPYDYICNSHFNPHIQQKEASFQKFKDLSVIAEKDNSVQKYIRKVDPSGTRRCIDLKDSFKSKCEELKAMALRKLISTRQRINKGTDVFLRAKRMMLTYLDKLQKNYPKGSGSYNKIGLMEKEIQSTEVKFDSFTLKGENYRYSFNASAEKYQNIDVFKLGLLSTFKEVNTIHIEGILLEVDQNPYSLLQTMLHELSHFLDVSEFPIDNQNPLEKSLLCLKRSDTADVQDNDISGLRKLFLEYKDLNPEYAEKILNVLGYLESTPDKSFSYPISPEGKKINLQKSQMEETFSDWLTAEVLSHSVEFEHSNNIGLYDGGNGQKIVNVKERLESLPILSESIAFLCNTRLYGSEYSRNSQYLSDRDRIEKVFLSNPKMNRALGCSEKYVQHVKSLKEGINTGNRRYCSPIGIN